MFKKCKSKEYKDRQTDRHPFNGPLFQDNVGKPARLTILNFNEATDDRVAVSSGRPYAISCTSLQTDNHASTSSR